MIPANHSPLGVRLWNLYSRVQLWRHFRGVHLHSNWQPRPGSVLLLQNHFSWWDGFISVNLNQRHWHRRFHVMMLEEELAKRRFLTWGGAYGISRGSRDVVEGLRYTQQLLRQPQNLVLFFPQGKIESMHRPPEEPFRFEQGVERLLPEAGQVVLSVVLPDYFSSPKPRLDVYVQEVEQPSEQNHHTLQELFNGFYREVTERQRVQH